MFCCKIKNTHVVSLKLLFHSFALTADAETDVFSISTKAYFFVPVKKKDFHHILTIVFLSHSDGPCGISKMTRAKAGQKTCALFPSLTQWRTFGRKWSLLILWSGFDDTIVLLADHFRRTVFIVIAFCLSPVIHVETSVVALKPKTCWLQPHRNSAALAAAGDADNWD